MTEEQVEAALLADVTGFLAGYNVSNSLPTLNTTVSGLQLTDDQLLAETDTLLSSLISPSLKNQPQEQFYPNWSQNTGKTSPEPSKSDRNTTKLSNSSDGRRKLRFAQATKRRLKHRQKLKDDKETLAQQEIELSSELTRLQKAQIDAKLIQMENVSLSAWKSIATHQKEKRVEAEQTQRHLRAAVIQRARIIHQMKIVIERPLFKENPKVYMYNGDGTALFKNFMGEMDAIYSQTDQVLKQAQFKISSSLTYTPSRTMRQGMEIFDSADAAIIPFEFKSTTRALNKLMLSDPDTSDFQATTNSLTMKNEVTFQLKADEVAKLRIYSAVQKYEEAGRVVFVLRSFTEGQGNLRGYNTEETGWFSVRPGDSTEDCKSAIIEVYTRFTPFSFGEASDGNVDADRFADIVAKSGEKEVNELGQMLEKLLLGEA